MAYYGVLADLSTTNTFTELNIFKGGVQSLVEPIQLQDLVTLNYFNTHIPSISPYALTTTNDTNIQLSLSGSPSNCLLAAANITASWSGVLATVKGGTGQSSYTDGQLLIGSTTTGSLVKSTLTAGPGISITNTPGSITIDTVSRGTVVSTATGTSNQILVNGTSSVPTSGDIILTLPQDISEESNVKFTTIALKSSTFSNFIQSSTLSANRNLYLPDADSSAIQPRMARTTNEYLTHIDSTGTQFSAQPTFSSLSGVLSPSQGGTGVNNGTATITLNGSTITLDGILSTAGSLITSGNFTTSGAFTTLGVFPLTLTTTTTTAVTLPASGTLATISSTVPSIQGSTNQISVNGSPTTPVTGSAVILSLPQNIHTAATPTFSSVSVGSGFRIAEGVNAKSGVVTLVSGAVTVSNTSVTANSRILLTPNTLAGVARPEGVGVTSRTPGANFVITSKGGGDNSVVYYQIIEPS
jgi:hypothetical protein